MTDTPQPEVVTTLEDDSGAFCVDILHHPEGHFSFVEYARDADDDDAWHERSDIEAKTYPSEFAAYTAATREVEWLID